MIRYRWCTRTDMDRSLSFSRRTRCSPRLSGRSLAERVPAVRPDLAMLFMSGYAGENIDSVGSLLGPRVGFLQKPFDPETLLAKLRDVLDNAAAEAA